MEKWKDVPGYEGRYEVSDLGRIKRISTGRILKRTKKSSGYLQVALYDYNLNMKSVQVHQIVMLAFVGKPPEGMCVCHNNNDKSDCRLENLRYDTFSENSLDIVRSGYHYEAIRDKCDQGHDFNKYPHTKKCNDKMLRTCLSCTRASRFFQRNPNCSLSRKQVADLYYEYGTESMIRKNFPLSNYL